MLALIAFRIACLRGRLAATARARLLLLPVIALALSVPAVQSQTAAKGPATPPATSSQPQPEPSKPAFTPDPNQPIALPDIANRAEELDRLLRDITKELAPSPELLAIDTSIKAEAALIGQRAQQLDPFLAGTPNPLELQEEDRYWRTLSEQYTSYRKLLTGRAAKLQEQVHVLEEKKTQWQATLAQIRNRKDIEAVIDRVNRALQEIEQGRAQTQAELNRVLNLQTQVSEQDKQISEAMAKLGETRDRLRGRWLERDGPPLWKIRDLSLTDDSLSAIAYRSVNRGFMGAGEYLWAKMLRIVAIIVLYLIALLVALRFRRDIGLGRFAEVPSEAGQIFARPYSVALLVAMLGTVGMTIAAPSGIVFVIYVLYSIQMVRLTPLLTHPRVLPLLYALATFGLLEGFYLLVQLSPFMRREVFAGIVLAALVTFAWLTRPSVVREWPASDRRVRVTLAGIRAGSILLGMSLLANLTGFVSLSHVVGVATLLGAFAAVLLYGVVRVLRLMLALGLRTWGYSLGDRREGLERWGGVALTMAGAGLWLDCVLYLFAVHESVADAISRALKYPIGFAKVHIIVGDVVSALLVLLAGYALANVFTFVLRDLVLSRMRLPRGLPLAASTILYYLLLLLVCFIAVSELGVEFNKLTLITGALGVGVGFGLQNTVSNFVSGLILLFERPIRMGDVVEVAGVVGAVRRIGVRSSTIHTFDDAEVIVPNNDLISNKVTNWTLSSPRRRVDIPVGVAYGTDPGPVLKLLVGVAESNPGVMRQPAPVAFFLGFGDSALNFELRFWSTQETWFQLKSDVAVAVAKALGDAGIEIPFPQRDLHLRSIDGEARSALHLAPPREGVRAAAGGGRTK